PLPPVEIVDMRRELRAGNFSIFSHSLQDALAKLESSKEQGILFINRRGHSTFVSCRSCGYVLECPHCDVSLSYHYTHEGAAELLRCHYCNYSQSHPSQCPQCSSPYLKFFGSGSQKVTQELTKLFPSLRPLRFDSDTTRNKGAHRNLLTKFSQGKVDLLVGTQMLTKGLDIAKITLVGVITADELLHLSDYRAAERTFQTLTQVAGRAGRGNDPGRVIIQTYSPEHPVIQSVSSHDYQGFIKTELPQREVLGYPPYGRLILIRLSGTNRIEVQQTSEVLGDICREQVGKSCEILGPVPAKIMRIARRYRWHILLKFSPNAQVIIPDINELRKVCPQSVYLTFDIDPLIID
ncbi:MAG: replication restart helicase PriA, partial [cyanobacterium endosymbiont of Rhopalodia yunnanensis]